jgi:ACS family sodium-dependent inorganic phosphate cotransporter
VVSGLPPEESVERLFFREYLETASNIKGSRGVSSRSTVEGVVITIGRDFGNTINEKNKTTAIVFIFHRKSKRAARTVQKMRRPRIHKSSAARELPLLLVHCLLLRETIAFAPDKCRVGPSVPCSIAYKSVQKRITPFRHSSRLFSSEKPESCISKLNFFLNNQPSSKAASTPLTSSVQKQQDNVDNQMIFTMMALIFVVGSLSSLDRVAMSVALVPMTEEMGYTDSIKGSISSLFSVGYGVGILPAGLLIASLSPRWVMAVGITFWSIGTIATPFAAAQSSMVFLLGARALVGASESVAIPTVQRLLSNWVPPERKSLAVATVFAGFQTGTILAYSLSPFLIDQFDDWRVLFYFYGGAGVLYLVPWLLLAQDSPSMEVKSPKKSRLDESETSFGMTLSNAKETIAAAPWKAFVSSKGVWAMFLAHAANNWGLYNNLSWTPTFYSEQYGLNVKESALLLVVPSIAGAIGGLSAGTIADSVIQNLEDPTDEAITNIRKVFQGTALFGPSICLGTLAYTMPEDPAVAQILLSLAVGLQSFNAAGYGAANQEKAGEKWTGLLYGITSLPSVMIGTFAVYLTGRILDYTDQNWNIVFGLNSVVYFLGAAAFVTLYDSKKEFD